VVCEDENDSKRSEDRLNKPPLRRKEKRNFSVQGNERACWTEMCSQRSRSILINTFTPPNQAQFAEKNSTRVSVNLGI
jgi:hypothetical protein